VTVIEKFHWKEADSLLTTKRPLRQRRLKYGEYLCTLFFCKLFYGMTIIVN
jgi:hypothetical protein